MSLFSGFKSSRHVAGQLAAINRSQAVIEFDLDGKVVDANENFLDVMGYSLAEVKGQHHSLFMPPEERDTPAYKQFWDDLRRGEFARGQYLRVGKGGREVWIQASYNPIIGAGGKPVGVIKSAFDVTEQKNRLADLEGQRAAIDKAQAVIEFDLDGRILHANENFLAVLGYALPEILGQHHRLFVDPAERESSAYKAFWERLGRAPLAARAHLSRAAAYALIGAVHEADVAAEESRRHALAAGDVRAAAFARWAVAETRPAGDPRAETEVLAAAVELEEGLEEDQARAAARRLVWAAGKGLSPAPIDARINALSPTARWEWWGARAAASAGAMGCS